MHAAKIVIDEIEGHHRGVVLQFFEIAFVRRVNRRIDIRIVRFCRSTYDVLTCFGSGVPLMIFPLAADELGGAVARLT